METTQKSSLLKIHLYLGAAAGFIYAFFAWGIDAFQLAAAHVSMPWLKFAIAILPILAIFTLVGWLNTKISHMVLCMLLWMVLATGLSYLISLFSFQFNAEILRSTHPEVSTYINYITPTGISSRRFVIIVMTNILFMIGGVLFDTASQSYFSASGTIGWLIPVLLCLALFGGAGYVADSNANAELRTQLVNVDEQLEEVSQLDLGNLSERDQRLVRRFTKLDVDLAGPRKLVIGSFDDSFSQVNMLINFDGTWVNCLALNGHVGNCEMLE
jgi:hypothetical protein